MEHISPLGSFHRENGTTFSKVLFIPKNFQCNEPKSRVRFASQPEFPEFFGYWKTTLASETEFKPLGNPLETFLKPFENSLETL